MSDIEQYYKDYYVDGGYTMEQIAESSRPKLLKKLLQMYTNRGDRVLDIGCGDMYMSTQLPDRVWMGVDINTEKAVGQAKTHNLNKAPYPFSDERFEAVLCTEVMEHLWSPELVYNETYRLLVHGGIFIATTPNPDNADTRAGNSDYLYYNPADETVVEHIRLLPQAAHKALAADRFKLVQVTTTDHSMLRFYRTATRALVDFGFCGSYAEVDSVLEAMFPGTGAGITLVWQKI